MKSSEVKRSAAADRFNAKCRFEANRAQELGLEIQPSVNGPYLVERQGGRVVAGPRSKKFHEMLYGAHQAAADAACKPLASPLQGA